MKELLRELDFTRVGYFQSVVEDAGIATFVRNQNLTCSGLTEIPIPEFYPALCVVNDEDYPEAIAILRQFWRNSRTPPGPEVQCPGCGESNPGNFELCWHCGTGFAAPAAADLPSSQ